MRAMIWMSYENYAALCLYSSSIFCKRCRSRRALCCLVFTVRDEMYVCIYAYMHICIYAYMHICMYVCMHACMYACTCVCMYACMHVCMYACASMYAEWTMSPTIPCIHCKRWDWLRRHACAHEHLGGRNVVRGTHEEEGYACRIHVYIHLISDSEYKAAHTKRNAVPAVVWRM